MSITPQNFGFRLGPFPDTIAPMDILVVASVAFFASILTFFSGFGLGTLMVPVFALFFPIELAVAATAVVHFANNIFKTGLIGKFARRDVVLRFGLAAGLAAIPGALLLDYVSGMSTAATFNIDADFALFGPVNIVLHLTPVKFLIGLLIVFFAVFDLKKSLRDLKVPEKLLPLGGALSGFFGGLSGNQGALRATFLTKLGLNKEEFVATGTVISLIIDAVRIAVYGATFATVLLTDADGAAPTMIGAGVVAAMLGAVVGRRLLAKTTIGFIRTVVGTLMVLVGAGLMVGAL